MCFLSDALASDIYPRTRRSYVGKRGVAGSLLVGFRSQEAARINSDPRGHMPILTGGRAAAPAAHAMLSSTSRRRRLRVAGFGLAFLGAMSLSATPAFAQDYGEGYVPATRAGAGAVPMLDQDMTAAVTGLVKNPDIGLPPSLRDKFGKLVSVAARWAPAAGAIRWDCPGRMRCRHHRLLAVGARIGWGLAGR